MALWIIQLSHWGWSPPAATVGLLLLLFLLLTRGTWNNSKQQQTDSDIWAKVDTVGVGRGAGPLSWALAMAWSVTSMQSTVREGYYAFSKAGKPFVLPTMWARNGALLVLPPSMLHLLNRPRDQLSSFDALLDNAQFQYLMTDRDVYANTIHFDIVRKDLAPGKMSALAAVMAEEWPAAFEACWGVSREGAVVNAWDSMVRIIARVALRIMVGLPGCRDEAYLEQSRLYANAVLVDACFINSVPPAIRPAVAPLIALRARYHQRKLMAILVPMVEERIRQYRDSDGKEGKDDDGPGDVIQWLIRVAANHGPEQLTSSKIAMRVLALTSMFVFAIGWVFVHAVLDIYCAPPEEAVAATLESECRAQVAESNGNLFTKEGVDALYRLDSAVRESMRLNDVMVHLMPLDVLAGSHDGIDLGNGLRVTAGSGVRTVFPARMVHLDPDLYPAPDQFDAFRFSREFDGDDKSRNGGASGAAAGKRKLMTTVTTDFLPFGYGRHACPGRWFVAHMVKQGIAYVLLNYDVKVTKRPGKKTALLNFMMPPQAAELKVRWRGEGTGKAQ